MIVDIKKIKLSGKSEVDFFYEYVPDEVLTENDDFEIEMPVKVTGRATLTSEHGAYVEGEIVYTLNGACTRCLKETSKEFIVPFAENVDDENENGYEVINDKIDLKKIVNDGIILNMPISFLCEEDCKGICSGCGVNLNEGTCKCKK